MVGAHFVSIHDPTNKAACRIKQSEMMDVLFLATTASWGLNIRRWVGNEIFRRKLLFGVCQGAVTSQKSGDYFRSPMK